MRNVLGSAHKRIQVGTMWILSRFPQTTIWLGTADLWPACCCNVVANKWLCQQDMGAKNKGTVWEGAMKISNF